MPLDVAPELLERIRARREESAAKYGGDPERTTPPPGLPSPREALGFDRIIFSGPDLRTARFVNSQAPRLNGALLGRVHNRPQRPREHRPRSRARARAPTGDDPSPEPDLDPGPVAA